MMILDKWLPISCAFPPILQRLIRLIKKSNIAKTPIVYASVSVSVPSLLQKLLVIQPHPTTVSNHVRDILYSILLLEGRPYLVRQLSRYLDRIHARDVTIQPLPLCDPRPRRVRQGDDALKDLRCAAFDLVLRAGEVEEFFAVRASFVTETLFHTRLACCVGCKAEGEHLRCRS